MHSNIFPVEISFDEFQVQRLPYQDGLLDSLRGQYNITHSFFRNDKWIYISSGTENAEQLGELTQLKVQENIEIVGALIKHIFFRTFIRSFPDRILGFDPFLLLSTQEKDNLLTPLFPKPLSEISFKKVIEISFRPFKQNSKIIYGMLINTFYKWFLEKNCLELSNLGIDLTNLEVNILSSKDTSKGVVAPEENSLGRIIKVLHLKAIVDTNDGKKEYFLNEIYLNRSTENIKIYLTYKLGERSAELIINNIKDKRQSLNNPVNAFKEITPVANRLFNLDYKNYDGFTFNITEDNEVKSKGLN